MTSESVILIIFILIIIYYSAGLANGVKFLSANEGRAVFRKAGLCNYMNNYELLWRVKAVGADRKTLVESAQNIYNDAIQNFSAGEKTKIRQHCADLPANIRRECKFIKINGIDNDWPYTIFDYIVLPEGLLADIVNGKYTKDKFVDLIYHELYHIYQRRYQREFNKYYMAMELNKVALHTIKTRSIILLNPDDEINVKWLTYQSDPYFLLPTLCVEESGKAKQKVLYLKGDDEGIYSEIDSWDYDDCPYKDDLYAPWLKMFPEITAEKLDKLGPNRHSPNEITACLNL